jgi:AraC family transcriptional regulator of adaptative response/methylated-DNA-[protein]-cysteine methyltransferase
MSNADKQVEKPSRKRAVVSKRDPLSNQSSHYKLVEAAIAHIHQNLSGEVRLGALAQKFHVSEFYFQKIFKKWAGISPKQYVQYLKLQVAKASLKMYLQARSHTSLKSGPSLLGASIRSGFSSVSRVHDLFVTIEAMTPQQYREMGSGMEILYGFHETPFGRCLIGVSARGVCFLNFLDDEDDESKNAALSHQQENWKNARFKFEPMRTRAVVNQIFKNPRSPVKLLLKGTNFQIKVWEALLKIGQGNVSSYGRIAEELGQPHSARAVGNACGHNDLAFIIPCHRVLTASGGLGGYRWGEKRKRTLLEWEHIKKNPRSLPQRHPEKK